jgi:hypothetical protein
MGGGGGFALAWGRVGESVIVIVNVGACVRLSVCEGGWVFQKSVAEVQNYGILLSIQSKH